MNCRDYLNKFQTIIIGLILCLTIVNAQENTSTTHSAFYFSPEYMRGLLVQNHSNFPESSYSSSFSVSLGWLNNSTSKKKWASFYNFPFTGVTISASNLGNDSVFGNQYSLMPYIIFNTANRLNNSVFFKIGLGCSHFTKFHNELENRTNKVIGSGYTWSFQAFIYYSLLVTEHMSVQIGSGYLHSSNGHTQLPNIGLNQGVLSITAQIYPKRIDPHFHPKSSKLPVDFTRSYYYMVRNGVGFHEYGNAGGPVGGQKRLVSSISLSTGIIFRQQIKVEAGLAGRFYRQYYYNILNPIDSEYYEKPKLNASNLYFFLGCEFLVGHIGLDIEGGLNLYKPFFRRHYTVMEGEIDTDYWLKQLFNTKLGLNYYLINTSKKPKTNLFFGATINANFGQADFSEACIGIVHNFK